MQGELVILVRQETSPEDVGGMHAAQGILTARGGMTSHAAVVARGWGKPCVCGCDALHVNLKEKVRHTHTHTPPLALSTPPPTTFPSLRSTLHYSSTWVS